MTLNETELSDLSLLIDAEEERCVTLDEDAEERRRSCEDGNVVVGEGEEKRI
jgi:hypothetical protein